MSGITRHMLPVIDFIRAYRLEHGYCPSYSEISRGIGLKSKGGVARVVGLLEERGKIRRLPGKSRSIELIPAAPVLSVELPPHLYAQVQDIARKAKVTPEAVVIEAVRDGFAALRSKSVPKIDGHETSPPEGSGRVGLASPKHTTMAAGEPARPGRL